MPGKMVPMISPSGAIGDVPEERVQEAVKAGFKIGVDMTSPSGKPGVIPMDRVHDAMKSNFQMAPPSVPDPRKQVNMQGQNFNPLEAAQYAVTEGVTHPQNVADAATRGMKQSEREIQAPAASAGDGFISQGIAHDVQTAKGVADTSLGAIKAGVRSAADIANLTTSGEGAPRLDPGQEWESNSTAQSVGAGAEGVTEWVGGEAVLKGILKGASLAAGLGDAEKAKKLIQAYETVQKAHPLITGAAEAAGRIAKQATVGAGLGALHDGKEGAVEGAIAGGAGGALGEVVGAGAKLVRKIAPTVEPMPFGKHFDAEGNLLPKESPINVPIRASQTVNGGVARSLESMADGGALDKFAQTQTLPAAQEALQNGIPSNVLGNARQELGEGAVDHEALVNAAKNILDDPDAFGRELQKTSTSFGDAAQNIKGLVREHVFSAIDEFSGDAFSKAQEMERDALKQLSMGNNVTEARKLLETARGEQDSIVAEMTEYYGKDFGKKLDTGRRLWRQASAMEDLQNLINKSTHGSPAGGMAGDSMGQGISKAINKLPETINGKQLLEGLRKLDVATDGSLSQLDIALGANAQGMGVLWHKQALYTIANILSTAKNTGKVNSILGQVAKYAGIEALGGAAGAVAGFPVLGILATPLAIRKVLGWVMTSPKGASQLARALKVGASTPKAAAAVWTSMAHKDTHIFDVQAWKQSHPGEDAAAAKAEASRQGYPITDNGE